MKTIKTRKVQPNSLIYTFWSFLDFQSCLYTAKISSEVLFLKQIFWLMQRLGKDHERRQANFKWIISFFSKEHISIYSRIARIRQYYQTQVFTNALIICFPLTCQLHWKQANAFLVTTSEFLNIFLVAESFFCGLWFCQIYINWTGWQWLTFYINYTDILFF